MWYCFMTRPQREVYTTHKLRQHGFGVILLMRPELKRAHRRHRVQTVAKREPEPALRPYVFVDMSAVDSWARLHDVPADIRAVGINGQPPRPLSAAGVAYITSPARGLWRDTEVPKCAPAVTGAPAFSIGDRVQVFGAGFDGLKGAVVDVTGEGARVLLPLFGSVLPVQVPYQSIIKAA